MTHILITYSNYYKRHNKAAFEDFEALKKAVINQLDGIGWDNKHQVDLRSVKSCIYYLFNDSYNITIKKSKSYNKFLNYKYSN